MISPIQPSPNYDPNNESQFRTQVRQELVKAVKVDEAVPQIMMLDDTGAVGWLKIVAGVPTWEAIAV